jgi:hypothetical protein
LLGHHESREFLRRRHGRIETLEHKLLHKRRVGKSLFDLGIESLQFCFLDFAQCPENFERQSLVANFSISVF